MDDVEGFAAFAAASGTHLYRLALLLTRDESEAQDATQDALVRTARHWRRARQQNPQAYARRALTSVVIDGSRKRAVRDRHAPILATMEHTEDHASQSAVQLDLHQYLLQLPPSQRVVLVMRYWADLSEADIALAMGVSAGTVKSHCSRALAALRSRIVDAEDADRAGH